jgi:hypothetical protein
MEAWQTQAVVGATREGDRQGRATADAPGPLGGRARVPGQIPAHPTATPLAITPPTPLLPQVAAPPTADPGVQRLDA